MGGYSDRVLTTRGGSPSILVSAVTVGRRSSCYSLNVAALPASGCTYRGWHRLLGSAATIPHLATRRLALDGLHWW